MTVMFVLIGSHLVVHGDVEREPEAVLEADEVEEQLGQLLGVGGGVELNRVRRSVHQGHRHLRHIQEMGTR